MAKIPPPPVRISYLHPKAREAMVERQRAACEEAFAAGRVRLLTDFTDDELDSIARRYGCKVPVRRRSEEK